MSNRNRSVRPTSAAYLLALFLSLVITAVVAFHRDSPFVYLGALVGSVGALILLLDSAHRHSLRNRGITA